MENIIIHLKEKCNSYFCVTPEKRCFISLHYISLNKLKNSNHRNISLTANDDCNSKLLKNIQFEKGNHFFFQYFRESSRKSKSKACILEELRVSFRMFKYKNEIEANEDAEMSVKQVQSAEYKKKKLKPFHSRSYGITKKQVQILCDRK